MTIKKYVLHPGYVTSAHDGERHYVSARQLMMLYRVDPKECLVDNPDMKPRMERVAALAGVDLSVYLHLYPMEHHYIPVSPREARHYPIGQSEWDIEQRFGKQIEAWQLFR